MVAPGEPTIWLQVDQNLCAQRGKWGRIKKEPSIASWADSRGFSRQGRIIFSIMSLWVVRRHQLAMGKDGGMPAMPAVK